MFVVFVGAVILRNFSDALGLGPSMADSPFSSREEDYYGVFVSQCPPTLCLLLAPSRLQLTAPPSACEIPSLFFAICLPGSLSREAGSSLGRQSEGTLVKQNPTACE